MSEQEKIELSKKIAEGLKIGYENLLRRKKALGQKIVSADSNGQPILVSPDELLKKLK